jgi:hypothetical protein
MYTGAIMKLNAKLIGVLIGLFVFSNTVSFSLNENKAIPVTVNTSKVIGYVSDRAINGFNFNNSMQVYTIRDKIAKLGIKTITAPGGDIGERDTITEDDMKFFKQQQGYLGTPLTFMQVRLLGGSKELAVEYIKLAKKYNVRVDYWTIGNEPDLYFKVDPSWTMAKYDSVFREYVTAMKACDPKIRVAGPAVSNEKDDWVRDFIYECGDLVDALVWHWYPSNSKASDAWAIRTAKGCLPMIERYRALLEDPKTNPKGYTRDIKLGLNEWAVHSTTDIFRHLTDMTGVLWSAETLSQIAESGIDFSNYFCLNQYGGHAIFTKLNKPRLLYYLFVMFEDHFGREVLESSSTDEDLFVSATRVGVRDLSVFLVNENPTEAKKVRVAFGGVLHAVGARAYELTENVKYGELDADRVTSSGNSVSVSLSPFSVTVLRITKGNR